MTSPSEPPVQQQGSLWPLTGWVIFALASAAVAVSVMFGLMMRAVVLDIVSFWPAWILAAVVAVAMIPLGKRGRGRVGAIAPLLLFSWLVGAVGLHFSGWAQLPSAAGDLRGPEVGAAATAELSIDVTGRLVVRAGSDRLYEVTLARSGGSTGPAEALERTADEDVVVRLLERPDGGWFESSGWEISISRTPTWALVLAAGSVDLDLATVAIRSLELVTDGEARLASPVGEIPIMVNGRVELEIPRTASVEVIGLADVPDSFEVTEGGSRFIGEGTSRYVVSVASGATLIVRQW